MNTANYIWLSHTCSKPNPAHIKKCTSGEFLGFQLTTGQSSCMMGGVQRYPSPDGIKPNLMGIASGYLEMTLPDQPSSRLQRYRLPPRSAVAARAEKQIMSKHFPKGQP